MIIDIITYFSVIVFKFFSQFKKVRIIFIEQVAVRDNFIDICVKLSLRDIKILFKIALNCC